MSCNHSESMLTSGCAGCEADYRDRAEKAEARVAEMEKAIKLAGATCLKHEAPSVPMGPDDKFGCAFCVATASAPEPICQAAPVADSVADRQCASEALNPCELEPNDCCGNNSDGGVACFPVPQRPNEAPKCNVGTPGCGIKHDGSFGEYCYPRPAINAACAPTTLGGCTETERSSALAALRKIASLEKHDSPVYQIAVEQISVLLAHAPRPTAAPTKSSLNAAQAFIAGLQGSGRVTFESSTIKIAADLARVIDEVAVQRADYPPTEWYTALDQIRGALGIASRCRLNDVVDEIRDARVALGDLSTALGCKDPNHVREGSLASDVECVRQLALRACSETAPNNVAQRIANWLRRYADEHSASHPANSGHIACNAAANAIERGEWAGHETMNKKEHG